MSPDYMERVRPFYEAIALRLRASVADARMRLDDDEVLDLAWSAAVAAVDVNGN